MIQDVSMLLDKQNTFRVLKLFDFIYADIL